MPGTDTLAKWKNDRKIDLILHTTTDLEFGRAETGKFFKSEIGTKWVMESGMKLPKHLKDMFMQLAAEVRWSEQISRELVVYGFIHASKGIKLCPLVFTDLMPI